MRRRIIIITGHPVTADRAACYCFAERKKQKIKTHIQDNKKALHTQGLKSR